jgi:uncharacterized protein
MEEAISQFLAELCELPDFVGADASDLNVCSTDGDNALHVAVRRNDRKIAKALIDAGIDVNKAGDLGYTPLHVASMAGNLEMVKLLVASGADLFALSEGYPPFTTARLAKQDHVCEFLGALMKQAQRNDPQIWIRARIQQLQRELSALEAKLSV